MTAITAPRLVAKGVSVRFGGLQALSDVSLEVESRQVTGLIGPNGAGKTTFFNVVTGLQAPSAGSIHFEDDDITAKAAHLRARLGIARTFQRLELFSRLSVYDNLLVAWESRFARGGPLTRFVSKSPPSTRGRDLVDEVVDLLELQPVVDQLAGSLSTGMGRTVEVARALCTEPSLLLMDEPSAGLDDTETDKLASILGLLVESRDIAILLVEHDVELVLRVCKEIFVLDFGLLIARGDPAAIRANPAVREAYLGEDVDPAEVAVEAVGPAPISPTIKLAPPDEGKPPLLSVEDLRAGYGQVEVLQGISLTVQEGTVSALLGPNGAGKTTTLRAIAGLIPVTKGTVRIGDEDVTGKSAHAMARRGVGLIPEEGAVFPGLTVRENLEIFADLNGKVGSAELIELATTTFPVLAGRLPQRAGTLSGGEQRMLALSRALSPQLRLLLLDEISLGLAPLIVSQLFHELERLAASGITILLVEQYVHAALRMADFVHIMAKGRVMFASTPAELDESWVTAYVG